MKIKILALVAALGLMAIASSASAYMVNDNYVGYDGHGRGDVIGDSSDFNIMGADATLSRNELTITIGTNFAGKAGIDSGFVTGGIGYGDLFLSTGWNPYGSTPYSNDDAYNGNHWTYAFVLNNNYDNSGGSGELYQLPSATVTDNNPGAILTQAVIHCTTGCVFRNDQETEVNTSTATDTSVSGNWTVGNGFLSFSFNLADLNALGGPGLDPTDLGFHWNMTCGNDTIEGKVSVPEPGTVALLGLGLIGLGFVRRRQAGQEP